MDSERISNISFVTVTETPTEGATAEQLSMIRTRYEFAAEVSADKDVLEVACGPGMGVGLVGRVARSVVGFDFDLGLLNLARAHYGERFTFMQGDAGELPFDNDSFDVVLLLEVIYFLPDLPSFLSESRRVLRPGGRLLICSANRERPDFNPSPHSVRYYSAAELKQGLETVGFRTSITGGFPVLDGGVASRLITLIRKVAIALRLIPKTMKGKDRLKRLLFRGMMNIPNEITAAHASIGDRTAITDMRSTSQYKVVYACGQLEGASQHL